MATVITNLISAIPWIGQDIVESKNITIINLSLVIIIYFLVISVQLLNIQIGVINVVNNTKYNEIPSIPILKWNWVKKLNSSTNWYSLVNESNFIQIKIDINRFINEEAKAIHFIKVFLNFKVKIKLDRLPKLFGAKYELFSCSNDKLWL